MKGYPKYKFNERVKFTIGDETFEGRIYIIDEYGTWNDPSDVSYDILVDKYDGMNEKIGSCLYKHITEKLVEKV